MYVIALELLTTFQLYNLTDKCCSVGFCFMIVKTCISVLKMPKY